MKLTCETCARTLGGPATGHPVDRVLVAFDVDEMIPLVFAATTDSVRQRLIAAIGLLDSDRAGELQAEISDLPVIR